jgi:hypothetical protein
MFKSIWEKIFGKTIKSLDEITVGMVIKEIVLHNLGVKYGKCKITDKRLLTTDTYRIEFEPKFKDGEKFIPKGNAPKFLYIFGLNDKGVITWPELTIKG